MNRSGTSRRLGPIAAAFALLAALQAGLIAGCGGDEGSSDSGTGAGAAGAAASAGTAADAGGAMGGATSGGSAGSSSGGALSTGGTGDGGSGGEATGGGGGWAPPECTPTQPCTAGGVCVGSSCQETWTCMVARICTRDLVAFCGCDGETFYDSSSCPTRPVAYPGACEDGVNCDLRDIRCRMMEPACPEMQVPEVAGECYGDCVPIDSCRCNTAEECPHPESYTCWTGQGHCGPYVM